MEHNKNSLKRYPTGISCSRIAALITRHWYLYKGSWPRIIELIYWPTLQMLMWGFLQSFLADRTEMFAQAGGLLLGAVLLWDVLMRSQLGLSVSFMEEMWSRNLGHLMVSPLKPIELLLGLITLSIFRTLAGIVPVSLLAIWFFGFNIYQTGLMLAVFFLNLVLTGWAIGLVVSGLILRNGMGAQGLAWSVVFLLLPITCVYYPLETLPAWLQPISLLLAPTYVFEGMRSILIDQTVRYDYVLRALGLNALYISGGIAAFFWFFREARRNGSLLQTGE
jgi:ABC-2 type transport system permease protein